MPCLQSAGDVGEMQALVQELHGQLNIRTTEINGLLQQVAEYENAISDLEEEMNCE